MPAVDIQGVGRVHFPDDYSPERIQFAIENDILPQLMSPAAQDTERWAQQIRKETAPGKLARVGRGVADVTQGIKQGGLMLKHLVTGGDEADAYTKEKTEELARYERDRGKDAGIDWLRLGGNIGMTAPAALIPGGATVPIRMLAGAATGGGTSALMFTPEGESKGMQTLLGALFGGAAPLAVEGVKRAAAPIARKIGELLRPASENVQAIAGELQTRLQQQGINWNELTQKVKDSLLRDAQDVLETGGKLDDAMLKNKALIESVGAKGTKAALSRDPGAWQTQKNLRGIQGVGDDIVAREQSDAAAMVDYLQKLRGNTGGKAATALEAGESAVGALKTQDTAKEKAVNELYDAFRSTGAADAAVPDAKIAETLGRVADEIGAENIPAAVMNRLKEFGFTGGGRTKLLTVNEADKLNRLINNNNPGNGPAALALGKIKSALNEALLEVPGEGSQALMKAREAAAKRFAEGRASTGIAAALDDVAPDRFVKKFILDADAKDLKATLAELGKSGQGNQAVSDIKGHILDSLLLKSTGATNIDDVAGKAFSGAKFGKALDSIAPEKLHALFSPDELQSLRTLQKASKLLTEDVAFSDVNYSKTSQALANLFLKIGSTPLLGKIVSPIIGAGKIGSDWVKNAQTRKEVADALLASAGQPGQKRLPAKALERVAPASLGAAINQPSKDSD